MPLLIEHDYDQNIVTLGGGGGSNVILEGLTRKNNPKRNKAVFGVWDDGSLSGATRRKYGVMPPGDMFMCMLGMSEDPEQMQEMISLLVDRENPPLLRDLLYVQAQRRHQGMEGGIDSLRKLLRIQGELIPVSQMDLHLSAETKIGRIINGEGNIDKRQEAEDFDPADVTRHIFFDVRARATERAVQAILGADKVVIVPGSPYTSIFPHLLVHGIPEALMNAKGELVVIPNLTTAVGEDHHLDALSKWVQEFQFLLTGRGTVPRGEKSRIDYMLINNQKPPAELVRIYEDKGQKVVQFDRRRLQRIAQGIQIVERDLLDEEELKNRLIRHDPLKSADALLQIPLKSAA